MTVVGITAGRSRDGVALDGDFVRAVLLAGATPLIIPVGEYPPGRLIDALERIDALVLSGGGDVDPARFGALPTATLHEIDAERDDTELTAAAWAIDVGLRTLGVCRGAQILTVASGGTLIQDLPSAGYDHHLDPRYDRRHAGLFHSLKTKPESLVAHLTGDLLEVNSHHHQAVGDPGLLLKPSAWASDGVIEALEAPGLLAVQWHPESLIRSDRRHLRPFEWLVTGDVPAM